MANVLGVNAVFHDPAAAVVVSIIAGYAILCTGRYPRGMSTSWSAC